MNLENNNIAQIQSFLEGKNNDVKYLVNVETDDKSRFAKCVIHEPNKDKIVKEIEYTPFIYMKDLKKTGHVLFNGNKDKFRAMLSKYGIQIQKMKTGNHPRLENGYPYKVTSTKSYSHIMEFLKEAGIDPWEKVYRNNQLLRDAKGRPVSKNRDLFFLPKLNEQFFISTGIRLFKGFEDYNHIHKLTFDIETTGLRYEHSRIFAIGIKDNRGFECVLEVEKDGDDECEKEVILNFFKVIAKLKPAIISGYNSEMFDFDFIINRALILDLDLKKVQTTLDPVKNMWRKKSTVKFGNTTENYEATIAYGYTILDIIHAVKKTVAVNTDIKNSKLKYICQFEGIAKPNRMYIDGKEIGRFWHKNPIFILNGENNKYVEIPKKFAKCSSLLLSLQEYKKNNSIDDAKYENVKKSILDENPDFIIWLKNNMPKIFDDISNMKDVFRFENGKNILRRYLLDDLWETEQVDNLYNQSSFLLAKIVPTTYSRVATMGNAAVWNLLMTTWSYENDLAIPHPDEMKRFSGGLTRCYKKGYTKRLLKIDYASLYPMIQLTHDVFPMFDITGVIKNMLSYMTTTRNIYKKLASSSKLKDSEISLLKTIDNDTYVKYINNSFTTEERNLFKVKQLPIKILNNSLFGALGSGFAFNWSDNICAARITTTGRLYLRMAITYFKKFGLVPLLAVTDGINFGIPDKTTIRVTNDGVTDGVSEGLIEDMWQYNGKTGVSALIEKFNDECMPKPYMSVDNDGEFDSCLNLSRINYALKTSNKIKLTGNTIKSKTMPEYIEEFIDKGLDFILNGQGQEFVDYYYDYSESIFYKQIPLKKIASKSKFKINIDNYINRGVDKNGKLKAKQAHMELIIADRERIAREIFEKDFEKFKDDDDRNISEYSILDIMDKVETYMPPEPELDSLVYYVNTGTRKSHGDVKADPKTGETVINAKLINQKDLEENPDITGEYNVDKYLAAFNKRVEVLLDGFDPEIREDILVKIARKKVKDASGAKIEQVELIKNEFNPDQLILQNFDHDNYDESMYLEDKEVEFWNESGYDPKLVWDGFNLKDSEGYGLLHGDIYNHAIEYLSDLMVKSGKPKIKSIDSKLNKGDYVLIKYNDNAFDLNQGKGLFYNHDFFSPKYNIGYFNGDFVEIIKENVDVPLSPKQIQWEENAKLKEEEVEKLRLTDENYIKELKEKQDRKLRLMMHHWDGFVKEWNLPQNVTMEQILSVEKGKLKFESYIDKMEKDFEPEPQFYDDDM